VVSGGGWWWFRMVAGEWWAGERVELDVLDVYAMGV
jgi:hypothetical protein